MSNFTRRDVCVSLPALSLFSLLSREAAAQSPAASAPAASAAITNVPQTNFSQCKAFPFDQLPVRYSESGAATRNIASGTVPTGEFVELHETTLGPGMMPHAAHQHPHEEFILVREGMLDFIFGNESHIVGAGGVAYMAPNQMHGMKNVGATQASYFVFALSKK
jgi:mannose-6-phosphate isomerase-like protein (cupin superfamily)